MPDPATQQTGPQKASAILTALSQIMPGLGKMFGGGGGGAGPQVSPGIIGQVPQAPQVPQVAGAGAGAGGVSGGAGPMAMPGRMAGPMGPASQIQGAGTPNPPQSGLYQSGFEFDTKKGRDAAVVTSAIQGVTQFLTQMKQRKEAKTARQAENYMTQIAAAQQSGDQEALNLLLEDPKVLSTLEKGLDFIIPKTPGEPPPPEATGVLKAINKMKAGQQRLPAPNTPGGVVWPRMPQAASNEAAAKDITSGAALKALQGDPQLARGMGLGTTLTGQEARDAERFQTGLATAPAEQRRQFLASQAMMDKIEAENKQQLAELASKKEIAMAGFTSTERQQSLANSPLFYRANIARDIANSQVKIKEMVANGKVGEANKIAMQTITSQINNLRSNATKLEKDNPDIAVEFTKQADDLQKQYDELRKLNEFNVDQIIKDIFAEP